MATTTKVASTIDNKQLKEEEREHKFKQAWKQNSQPN
jgi:hypothetical protein